MKNKIILVLLLVCALSAPVFAKAITMDELRTQIASLQAQIANLLAQLAQQQGNGTTAWCHTFNTNLGMGTSGAEFEALQTALMKDGADGTELSYDSAGMGQSSKFGEYTASAVVEFQEKYASEILKSYGLAHGTGYVGKSTRAKLNKLYGCGNDKPKVCPTDAKQCSDGSYVGRSGPDCGFALCPTIPVQKSISVVSPNGGEQWFFDSAQTINWSSTGIFGNITIYLWFPDGGMCKLADTQGNLGKYTVTLQENQQCSNISKAITAGQYKISIWEANSDKDIAALHDASDDYFTIIAPMACADTDNGNNIYIKGQTSGIPDPMDDSSQTAEKARALILNNGYYKYTDYCVSDSVVKEFYCGSRVISVPYQCLNGCFDGACNVQPVISTQ